MGIWTLAACIRVEDFATGPLELDIDKLHKAVVLDIYSQLWIVKIFSENIYFL